uniref:Uncharacterized protein n=1 Tax=Timema douglasi TaxID=61478 RepID=A0A7R8VTX7_TIMDO|nr:unnamed protein product [Timema douglasi]
MASLVLTDSSQLTSVSQHLGIYSSPVASLVLTDSSQLTSDSQHLVRHESSALDRAATEHHRWLSRTKLDLFSRRNNARSDLQIGLEKINDFSVVAHAVAIPTGGEKSY